MSDAIPATAGPSPFEQIRQTTEEGGEYWSARALARLLDYTDYRNFLKVLARARTACVESGHDPADHFVEVTEMIEVGKGARRRTLDTHLSRYAGYLVIMNGDAAKPIIALGQSYFAIQTRRAELQDAPPGAPLPGPAETQKRLETRTHLSRINRELATAAEQAGVLAPQDFAVFQNHGYRGLYGGESVADIHARKGLRGSQHILDHMNSAELAANAFRAALAEEKLRRDQVQGKAAANQVHEHAGRAVRRFLQEEGATLPENQPTPAQSIDDLKRAEKRRLPRGPQPPLLPEGEEPGP